MASLGSYLPEGGRAVWRRDRQPEYAQESQAVRHIVIRGTEVVPHPSPHVVSHLLQWVCLLSLSLSLSPLGVSY